MKTIAIADTHGLHRRVTIPEGDVLIVAGDICPQGKLADIEDFNKWLIDQPCRYKIVIAGNHDRPFEFENKIAQETLIQGAPDIIYLQDSFVEIEGITFYGSPWTPNFFDWYFMAERGAEIRKKWAMIPENVDVLITHGPPATILDNVRGVPEGCSDLLERVLEVNPEYNVFGHIHEGYGITRRGNTTFINASVCDGRYRPVNQPIVFDVHR